VRHEPTDERAILQMNLYHGHLGDHYPLCETLPERAFLKAGARYRLLPSARSQLQQDADDYDDGSIRLHPQRGTSALHRKLCWPDLPEGALPGVRAPCAYASDVRLSVELPCSGVECGVEQPRIIGVQDADGSAVYFEYLPVRSPIEQGTLQL
jgi:hypothetical protein